METDLVASLNEIKAGKPGAFEDFFALVEKRVFAFGLKVCGHVEDAKDTMQETLLGAFKALPHLDFKDSNGLFLGQISQERLFSQERRSDSMRAERGRWSVLDPVDKQIEGSDRRCALWIKAGDLCQARFLSEVGGECCDLVLSERHHQEQRAEHDDRIKRRTAARRWGVERFQGRFEWIQIQAEQKQCGGSPLGIEPARLSFFPLGKALRERFLVNFVAH